MNLRWRHTARIVGPGLLWLGVGILVEGAWCSTLGHPGPGAWIWAGLFNAHFWANVWASLLPFPIFGMLAAMIYTGRPLFRGEE